MRTIKTLVVVAMLLVCNSIQAQNKYPIDESTKLITYSKVIEIPNTSKADLYSEHWHGQIHIYKNPADVIREKNAEDGKMVCKGRFKLMSEPDKKGFQKDEGNMQYTLTVEAKDGKFRYKLTEINWKQVSYYPAEKWMDTNNQYYNKSWDWNLKYSDEQIDKIIADLKKYMMHPPQVKKDDW